MSTQAPSFIRFQPIYQTRVWGGRVLETRFGRELPDKETPFGESWEISAREEADSEVVGGALAGKTLRQLWGDPSLKPQIFGSKAPEGERFPLLFKILDARDKLSIQVHPPASVADELGGEPKTEVWYIAHAEPGAELYVGVEPGVDEKSFREALEQGVAEKAVHAIPVETGQHIFIPSGRLHAIGAGLLIYEIQQNSRLLHPAIKLKFFLSLLLEVYYFLLLYQIQAVVLLLKILIWTLPRLTRVKKYLFQYHLQ